MPQRGHRQGRPGHRPHQVDPGSRRVRGRFSVQGVDAGRELAARLQRRSAPARRHPGPNGIRARALADQACRTRRRSNSNRLISPACFRNTSRARRNRHRAARAPDQPVSLEPPSVTDRANGVPATYDFRRPYGAAPAPRYRPPPENSPRDDFSPEPYERRPLVDAPATSRNAPGGIARTPLREPPLAGCAAGLGARGIACGRAVSPRAAAGRPARPRQPARRPRHSHRFP